MASGLGRPASESGSLRQGDGGQGRGDRHWRVPKVAYALHSSARDRSASETSANSGLMLPPWTGA